MFYDIYDPKTKKLIPEGHANAFIYSKKDNSVEILEPSGDTNPMTTKQGRDINLDSYNQCGFDSAICNFFVSKFNVEHVYLVNEYCGEFGLQRSQNFETNDISEQEYCQSWSFWWLEYRFANIHTNYSRAKMIDEFIQKYKYKLTEFIRAYSNFVNETAIEFYKTFIPRQQQQEQVYTKNNTKITNQPELSESTEFSESAESSSISNFTESRKTRSHSLKKEKEYKTLQSTNNIKNNNDKEDDSFDSFSISDDCIYTSNNRVYTSFDDDIYDSDIILQDKHNFAQSEFEKHFKNKMQNSDEINDTSTKKIKLKKESFNNNNDNTTALLDERKNNLEKAKMLHLYQYEKTAYYISIYVKKQNDELEADILQIGVCFGSAIAGIIEKKTFGSLIKKVKTASQLQQSTEEKSLIVQFIEYLKQQRLKYSIYRNTNDNTEYSFVEKTFGLKNLIFICREECVFALNLALIKENEKQKEKIYRYPFYYFITHENMTKKQIYCPDSRVLALNHDFKNEMFEKLHKFSIVNGNWPEEMASHDFWYDDLA